MLHGAGFWCCGAVLGVEKAVLGATVATRCCFETTPVQHDATRCNKCCGGFLRRVFVGGRGGVGIGGGGGKAHRYVYTRGTIMLALFLVFSYSETSVYVRRL